MPIAVFPDFLAAMFHEGKVAFRSAGVPRELPTERDAAILVETFARFALSVAGPAIRVDVRIALEAAEVVRQACWALVDREERPEALRKRLRMRAAPSTPSEHLSADLTLRYLPQILGRARGLDPSDPMAEILVDLLRRWPLSGALADIDEPPLGPLDLGGHPGLLLLFAERIAAHDRPTWRPESSSPAYEYYRLVAGVNAPAT